MAVMRINLDAEHARTAISALADLAERRAEVVQAFLSSDEALFELRNVDAGGDAADARDLLVRLQPTERLRIFLAAAGAMDVEGVGSH